MNLVADEGVDKSIVDALRSAGFKVTYFAEVGVGTSDADILAAANQLEMDRAFSVISPGLLRIRHRKLTP